jgi:hypothetical protein
LKILKNTQDGKILIVLYKQIKKRKTKRAVEHTLEILAERRAEDSNFFCKLECSRMPVHIEVAAVGCVRALKAVFLKTFIYSL